jgi:hypothetical protein
VARAKGFQGICGRKKGATWNTAVVPAATDGIEVISLVPSGGTALIEDQQITGRVTQREAAAGVKNVTVTLRTALRYEGNGHDVAMVMGTAGTPATVDTTGRLHVFKVKDDLDGIFNTLAYESIKDTKVEELTSVKWTGCKITGKPGERVEIELTGIASNWLSSDTTPAASNTTTTIDSITITAAREYALFHQAVLWMNAQGGAGLAGTDAVYISGFEINIERGLDARHSTQGGQIMDEPIPNGFTKVSGSFDFAALQDGTGGNAVFLAEQMVATAKKATLTITSPTLAGSATEYYKWKLWFPYLQFGEAKVGIPGPGGPTWSIPFQAWHVATIPTGFTAGYLDAMTIENTNKLATDVLA